VVTFSIDSPTNFVFDVGQLLAVDFDIVEGISADTQALITPANFCL